MRSSNSGGYRCRRATANSSVKPCLLGHKTDDFGQSMTRPCNRSVQVETRQLGMPTHRHTATCTWNNATMSATNHKRSWQCALNTYLATPNGYVEGKSKCNEYQCTPHHCDRHLKFRAPCGVTSSRCKFQNEKQNQVRTPNQSCCHSTRARIESRTRRNGTHTPATSNVLLRSC